MKRDPLLVVSLAVNIALLGALIWTWSGRQPEPAPAAPTAPALAPEAPKAPIIAAPSRADGGSSLADLRTWLPQLQTAGVPQRVLAQLVAANFNADWSKRSEKLQEQLERGEIDDEQWAQLHRQRDADEEKAIRDAVGDDAFKAWHQDKLLTDMQLERANVTSDERDAIYTLRRQLLEQQREAERRHHAGEMDDAQVNKMHDDLQTAYEAKTRELLGEERYTTLQQPPNFAEGALRRTLATMNVTAAQAESVLAAEKRREEQRIAIDQASAQETNLSPEGYQAKLQVLDQERDAALLRELGPNGLETLRQLQDDRYRKLTKFAPLWQLNPNDVSKVYGTLRDYSQTVAEYRRQAGARGLSDEVTQEVINRFQQSTSASLRAAIGEEKYKRIAGSEVLDWDR